MIFKIIKVENGSKPNEEVVWLQASEEFNTKGFAVVDRTFDSNGKVSNEFRHIYVFPEIKLKKDQKVLLHSGTGTNTIKTFSNTGKEYHQLFWGADSCIWNDNGGDTATLISFIVVNSVEVPKLK